MPQFPMGNVCTINKVLFPDDTQCYIPVYYTVSVHFYHFIATLSQMCLDS